MTHVIKVLSSEQELGYYEGLKTLFMTPYDKGNFHSFMESVKARPFLDGKSRYPKEMEIIDDICDENGLAPVSVIHEKNVEQLAEYIKEGYSIEELQELFPAASFYATEAYDCYESRYFDDLNEKIKAKEPDKDDRMTFGDMIRTTMMDLKDYKDGFIYGSRATDTPSTDDILSDIRIRQNRDHKSFYEIVGEYLGHYHNVREALSSVKDMSVEKKLPHSLVNGYTWRMRFLQNYAGLSMFYEEKLAERGFTDVDVSSVYEVEKHVPSRIAAAYEHMAEYQVQIEKCFALRDGLEVPNTQIMQKHKCRYLREMLSDTVQYGAAYVIEERGSALRLEAEELQTDGCFCSQYETEADDLRSMTNEMNAFQYRYGTVASMEEYTASLMERDYMEYANVSVKGPKGLFYDMCKATAYFQDTTESSVMNILSGDPRTKWMFDRRVQNLIGNENRERIRSECTPEGLDSIYSYFDGIRKDESRMRRMADNLKQNKPYDRLLLEKGLVSGDIARFMGEPGQDDLSADDQQFE